MVMAAQGGRISRSLYKETDKMDLERQETTVVKKFITKVCKKLYSAGDTHGAYVIGRWGPHHFDPMSRHETREDAGREYKKIINVVAAPEEIYIFQELTDGRSIQVKLTPREKQVLDWRMHID